MSCSASFGRPDRVGFSLLEALIVVGIMAAIFGLLASAVQKTREAARRIACGNNLREIGVALHGYHDQNKALPAGLSRSPANMPYLAWSARLLPQLGQMPLWEATTRAFAAEPDFSLTPPHSGLTTRMPAFLCPSEPTEFGSHLPTVPRAAGTNYFGVSAGKKPNDGVLFPESAVRFSQITDGVSGTLIVGERGMGVDGNGEYRFGWWYAGAGQIFDGSCDYLLGVRQTRSTYRTPTCRTGPYHFGPGRADNPCDLFHHWSHHPGGAHFLFADGAVKFLAYSADAALPDLATRAGGESHDLPD